VKFEIFLELDNFFEVSKTFLKKNGLKIMTVDRSKTMSFKKNQIATQQFSINFETPHLVFGEERHLYMYLYKATQNNLGFTMVQE
jgi:hypothetical protein